MNRTFAMRFDVDHHKRKERKTEREKKVWREQKIEVHLTMKIYCVVGGVANKQ
jgi:hypothetical protein